MVRKPSRRKFVVSTGTAAAVGFAGCLGMGSDSEDESPNEESSDGEGGDSMDGGNSTDGSTDDGNDTDQSMDDESGDGSDEDPDPASIADDASVSFVEPTSEEPASGGVSVVMDAENVEIETSGEVNDDAGHFHVLVNTDAVEAGEVIPSDDQHIHFGDGSSETVLDLEPGDHELTLQLADGAHQAFDLTDTVEVTVEEASASFVGIEDGDTVSSPVELEWETENYEVEESGEVVQGAGHAHVLIEEEPVEVGEEIPSDDSHYHYGDGASSADLELEPGDYELTLQMGNGHHLATPLTDSVEVTVEE